ncbi:Ionotropic receptor 591 [Blattella germanica]|nr:Ionotropic receptor 591 [Blattella germanica]
MKHYISLFLHTVLTFDAGIGISNLHAQTAMCTLEAINRYFSPGKILTISFPASFHDDLQIVEYLLKLINNKLYRTVQVSRMSDDSSDVNDEIGVPFTNQNYVLFSWTLNEEEYVTDNIVSQIEELQYTVSWNPRAKFIIVIAEVQPTSPMSLAGDIFSKLWEMNNILNIAIFIINYATDISSKVQELYRLEAYSWFPYRSGHCGRSGEIIIVDKCEVMMNSWQFPTNISMFENKLPEDMMGCPLKVSTKDLDPFVILLNTVVDQEGKVQYNYSGLEIQCLYFIREAMNFTLEFLPPSEGDMAESHAEQLSELNAGLTDIIIGTFPLTALIVQFGDYSYPLTYNTLVWLVPCPEPVTRVDMILKVFKPSVWLTIVLVLVLSAFTFWITGLNNRGMNATEPHIYRTVSQCVVNSWSILLGVSLSELPRMYKLRTFFLLYVCYCFVMSTVFQTFFVSFLVSPGYAKPLVSLDDLENSDIGYGYDESIETFLMLSSYHEHERLSHRIPCDGYDSCAKRLLRKGDIGFLNLRIFIDYMSAKLGISIEGSHIICTLDENVFYFNTVMFVKSGQPLLDRINVIIRRITEAGLMMNYWSSLQFGLFLRKKGSNNEYSCDGCDSLYFVFQLSHLQIPFLILITGVISGIIALFIEIIVKRCL